MARFIVLLGVCSLIVAGAVCDCEWAEDSGCGDDDGGECWAHCCGEGALGTLDLCRRNMTGKVHCDCSWTNDGLLCGPDDQSECWPICCGNVQRCENKEFADDYGTQNCLVKKDIMTMHCLEKDQSTCGMRQLSKKSYGSGRYSVDVKAAPGDGICTAFYTYTYNRQNKVDRPWTEIDFEILGHHARAGSSKIWTNYWWGQAKQDGLFITVPFDVTKDFHNYVIDVSCTTIRWIVDGVTYRTVDISKYADYQCTLDEKEFQVLLSLWAQSKATGDWEDMSFIDHRAATDFPLNASFTNIKLPVQNIWDHRKTKNQDGSCQCTPAYKQSWLCKTFGIGCQPEL